MIESRKYRMIKNAQIADSMYQMSVIAPEIARAAMPGQFVHIKVPDDQSMILRRPISINSADEKSGLVDLVYQIAGKGTKLFSSLKEEDEINLLGPLGRGFDVAGAKLVALIGGGCGIAPLRFVPKKWPHLKLHSFLGFRSLSTAYQWEEFSGFSEEVHIASEDGSLGDRGYVTDLADRFLKDQKPDLILSCGPVPMLKKVQELAAALQVPCQLSLEEKMGCGIGGCLVCSCGIAISDGWQYKRVCADGPVFKSEEVLFHA